MPLHSLEVAPFGSPFWGGILPTTLKFGLRDRLGIKMRIPIDLVQAWDRDLAELRTTGFFLAEGVAHASIGPNFDLSDLPPAGIQFAP